MPSSDTASSDTVETRATVGRVRDDVVPDRVALPGWSGGWLRDAEPEGIRRRNLVRTLQIVLRDRGTSTRAGIARETGLTAATASSLVAQLIEEGFVVEGDRAASAGGRRPTTLDVDRTRHAILAVTVHPRALGIGVVNLAGALVHHATRELGRAVRADDVVAFALEGMRGQKGRSLLAVGIQVPGAVDGRDVIESVPLGWERTPLAGSVEDALGVPVALVNDAAAEAMAECAIGQGCARNRLFVHLGEGVGAARIEDGDLAVGGSGRAGEIGHVPVVLEPDARCRCGRSGCLESVASLSVILGTGYRDNFTAEQVRALAEAVGVRERIDRAAEALSRVLLLACALVDPDEVVIGYAVSGLGPRFLDAVNDGLRDHGRGTRPVVARYASEVRPFFGAAQFALRRVCGLRWQISDPAEEHRPGLR